MALFKTTWFMRYGSAGYSFSLYRTAGAITQMLLPSRNLRSVFGQLLGVGVEIPYWRVSDEGIKRDSLYQQEPAVVIGGGLQVGSGGPGWAQIKAAV